VQQIDNHFITPQVMQRTVHLHPAVVILALVAGGSLGGFFGLLLAVPTAAVLKILVSHVWRTYVLGEPIEPWVPEHPHGPGGVVDDVAQRPENQGDPPAGPTGADPSEGQAVLRT
jgi:hypothetical protein